MSKEKDDAKAISVTVQKTEGSVFTDRYDVKVVLDDGRIGTGTAGGFWDGPHPGGKEDAIARAIYNAKNK
ncbi:hypothetical protein [Nitrobacter sp. TKz-YC01]|uniref:hypothetical protein n=1 Tax=Nitrobacter sp. TKz-YC01 TaxID=3398703 RepID=UPI003A0FD8A4